MLGRVVENKPQISHLKDENVVRLPQYYVIATAISKNLMPPKEIPPKEINAA
jgi:hypothetical protein